MAHSVIYLVRHAKAGERRMWTGDDLERPLSKSGWKQAHALGKRLTKKGVGQLVSSPYVRCIQTLEPLAIAVGSTVETDDRLLEDAPFEGVLDLIAEVGQRGGAVQPRRRDPRHRPGPRPPRDAPQDRTRLAQGQRVDPAAQGRPRRLRHRLAPTHLTT